MNGFTKMIALSAVFSLAGCANTPNTGGATSNPLGPLASFTVADAKNAAALATANKADPQAQHRADCYNYIANALTAAASQTFVPGLLTLNEEKFAFKNSATSFGAACGGVLPMIVSLP